MECAYPPLMKCLHIMGCTLCMGYGVYMCIAAYGMYGHGFHLQKNLSSVKGKPYYFTSKLCQFLHVCASLPHLETLMIQNMDSNTFVYYYNLCLYTYIYIYIGLSLSGF